MNRNSALATGLCLSILCLISISLSSGRTNSAPQSTSSASEIEPYSINVDLPEVTMPLDDKFMLQLPNNFSDDGFYLPVPDNWPIGTIGIVRGADLPPTSEGTMEEMPLPYHYH